MGIRSPSSGLDVEAETSGVRAERVFSGTPAILQPIRPVCHRGDAARVASDDMEVSR